MNIGVLGAGRMGGPLGAAWAKRGHSVLFGVRDPNSEKTKAAMVLAGGQARVGTVREAVQHGDAVLLTVGWDAVPGVLAQGGDFGGKVLIDATNRLGPPGTGEAASAAQQVAQWAKGARVVKAFNSIGAGNLQNPQFGTLRLDAFICGDDAAAKQVVRQLAEEAGFDVVDVGALAEAPLLESLARLWIQLAFTQRQGPGIGFKLLRR